ncbi:Hypothetical predicted protein [Paramuricea clavata]|uniref:Uncharacterized protein n=1 Tax=Paramuricea clavata TaxID=317549 RepID=A0A7D9DX18_PARCT|nr:Hypothetical predicted protein [Paramuricea clavata]
MFCRLTKTVPKQCLVYFTIDDTTAVVPTKKIIMVEGARPITKGEKVMATYHPLLLNSLTGLVKQLIQQQHTNILLRRNEIVGDGGQVVATVGTSYQESEEDNNILPSTVPENSATDMPLSQPPPSSDLVSNDELAAIKLKSSGPTAFAGVLFRNLFTLGEMKGRNCRGLAKKGKLNEEKLNKIQEYVYKYYPDTPEQLSLTWAHCTQTIDSYIRNEQHKAKNI